MKSVVILLSTLFISAFAQAETVTYAVEGMHCGSCAKAIKAQVCKMEGLASCEVSVGKIVVSSKNGANISQDQIQEAVAKAGEYKIISATKSK
ncbi:MAG: heavy metal-associated domain-containing protein [Bdellovibrio sp.]